MQINDTRTDKFDLVFKLAADAENQLLPVYIISHKRSQNLRTLGTIPYLKEHATVVVSEEEAIDYDLNMEPGIQLEEIPTNYLGLEGGVGRARQFVLDLAHSRNQSRIILLDDDMVALTLLYATEDNKASRAVKVHIGAERLAEFRLGLLVLCGVLAEEAFNAEPHAVIASPQCNAASRTVASSRTRWSLNRGGPPAQIQVWDVDRFRGMCGQLDLARFNKHGDDIAVACQIIQAGGAVVSLPSIVGDWLDYETESVIRSLETAPALRQAEHDALMSLPLAPYIKTREDVLGRPQWHSLDWKRLHSDGKVQERIVHWNQPVGDPLALI